MLDSFIQQLHSPDAEIRYNAIIAIARMSAHDDWKMAWDAIDDLLNAGEPDSYVGSAAAIALSMLSARNTPGSMFYGSQIPDFLPDSYQKARVGLYNQPSPQDFDKLDELFGDLDDTAG